MPNLTISPEIYKLFPQFKLGVVQYDHIVVGDSPQMLRGRFELFQENTKLEFESKSPSDDPAIKEWRSIVKQCGADPSKYRHSAEALLRRVKKGNSIHTVNSAVDLTNLFSLQYKIPFGIYDLEKIIGPITLKIGTENEKYEALNGRIYNMSNKVVLCDQNSAFGSPFVDSNRTMVTKETKKALHIIYICPSMKRDEAQQLVSAVAEMFFQLHGGNVNVQLL